MGEGCLCSTVFHRVTIKGIPVFHRIGLLYNYIIDLTACSGSHMHGDLEVPGTWELILNVGNSETCSVPIYIRPT